MVEAVSSHSIKHQVRLVLGACCVLFSAAALLKLSLGTIAALLIGTFIGLTV